MIRGWRRRDLAPLRCGWQFRRPADLPARSIAVITPVTTPSSRQLGAAPPITTRSLAQPADSLDCPIRTAVEATANRSIGPGRVPVTGSGQYGSCRPDHPNRQAGQAGHPGVIRFRGQETARGATPKSRLKSPPNCDRQLYPTARTAIPDAPATGPVDRGPPVPAPRPTPRSSCGSAEVQVSWMTGPRHPTPGSPVLMRRCDPAIDRTPDQGLLRRSVGPPLGLTSRHGTSAERRA
jgi:hypothetical protein